MSRLPCICFFFAHGGCIDDDYDDDIDDNADTEAYADVDGDGSDDADAYADAVGNGDGDDDCDGAELLNQIKYRCRAQHAQSIPT